MKILKLKGVFARNEMGYRFMSKNYRWGSPLILHLSVASLLKRRKRILQKNVAFTQIQKVATYDWDRIKSIKSQQIIQLL